MYINKFAINLTKTSITNKMNMYKNKHIELLKFYNFEYDLEEIEKEWFDSLETLKRFDLLEIN